VVFGVKSGGTLALSGILVKELELVRAHYQARFAELRPQDTITVDSRQDGEWGDLQFALS
jgi:ribosomal protein L11 methylase PrmA